MTGPVLDFEHLYEVLAGWPAVPIPASARDGLFERARHILLAASVSCGSLPIADLVPILKHILRRESLQAGANAQFRVPLTNPWPSESEWARFGVSAHSQTDRDLLIEALPWAPTWLSRSDVPVFEDVFRQAIVRKDWTTPIDPFLAEPSGFASYVSPGQREAVRSVFLMRPGDTLIVCLPTGSGKSLVAQAPVLVRGLEGGLTLCVVPTTALALDQARQMSERLAARARTGAGELHLAWHAGLSVERKNLIKAAIRQGRQGVLYCSPEAVTGALLPALYDAAKAGLLDYFIVDEAHLLSQWGDGFRPAFQMIAGIRRGLLRECRNEPFRTILMSATLTPDAIGTIDALFGPAEFVQMVASVHLRPEPQYWIHREDDSAAKEAKILEAVRHAPRPLILYVTKRADAGSWRRRLQAEGFGRVATFHGKTPDSERLKIIEDWSQNLIDIIVATSAFGVGIDKSDVRAVIHAAVPEMVDRFYQEVGRGGRDGAPAGSLMIYGKADVEVAERIASPSLISDELAFDRWEAMYRNAKKLNNVGRRFLLDISTVPPKLRRQTDYNQAWNMRTLIMMARAGLLDLDAMAPEVLEQSTEETDADFDRRTEDHWASYYTRCIIEVNFGNHLDKAGFSSLIASERSRAFVAAEDNGRLLSSLISGNYEIGELLHGLYQSYAPGRAVIVSSACGGCPSHRRDDFTNMDYAEPAVSGIERIVRQDISAWMTKFPHLSAAAPIILTLPDPWDDATAVSIASDAVAVFNAREVAVSRRFRSAAQALKTLHRRSPSGMVLLETLEDEVRSPSTAPLIRVSILSEQSPPPHHVFEISRALHLIVASASLADPYHPGRRLGEVGANTLTLEQFRSGARQ
ncbi:DEAD/DEAH box helicase [Mesorhizobium sp. LNHC221B00]|uniref:protein DpdF n=1 Tax=Mesorhizobium sp. LNHC221B00 TaxID=1287233 RepID=UPI0003CEA58E|nr:protein DpdF [Mesorhizobium sp. LNHC221B00]ESY79308.1 DEAD/DEAH box helicase [Mesorhizobium sp. LNHC221B00]